MTCFYHSQYMVLVGCVTRKVKSWCIVGHTDVSPIMTNAGYVLPACNSAEDLWWTDLQVEVPGW